MRRAVKYCGGCNCLFDRKQLCNHIENEIGEKLDQAVEGECYDELYVICGCSSRCVDTVKYTAKKIKIFDHDLI